MRAHTLSMRMHLSSVLVHMHVCIRKLRVSCSLSFPKITSQSQDFARLDPNQPWTLEWCCHWRIGVRVVRGIEWGVYSANLSFFIYWWHIAKWLTHANSYLSCDVWKVICTTSCLPCVWETTLLEGCFQKEIWVLRAPLFWVIVWSRHLFFLYQKKKKKEKRKYNYMSKSTSNVIDWIKKKYNLVD